MFYPVESLKRGGRFHLCWVADSWPLRFAATTHKQLWSQDIRKLCDDLLEVMTNESGRPTHRFSLRLSSQLMRGLVRLYERKVTVLLSELCMINAHVFKHANKKFSAHEAAPRTPRALPPVPAVVVTEEPDEQRIEEMIQNSGNAVTNIQDITLKEAAIPDFQLPPNDGFGEENQEQVLQSLLGDRTVELMMAPTDVSAVQHSGLEQLDATEKSHDKTRLMAHEGPRMELVADHDVTAFRKSVPEIVLPEAELEKDIPDIPEIPLPAMPVPDPEMLVLKPKPCSVQPPQIQVEPESPKEVEQPAQKEPEVVELEELESGQQQPVRRRGKAKLIIDKRIQLGSNFLRARIDNINVELRCEDVIEDIVNIRAPWETYSRRPACSGTRLTTRLGDPLMRMFQRNLAVVNKRPLADREPQELVPEEPRQRRTRSLLDKTAPVQEQITVQEASAVPEVSEVNISRPNLNVTVGEVDLTAGLLNVTDYPNVEVQQPMDISDLPTQKLETISQGRKRTADFESPPKRQKSGYVSFRESQQMQRESLTIDKENIPPQENIQPQEIIQPEQIEENIQQAQPPRDTAIGVSTMLHEAGLADMQPIRPEVELEVIPPIVQGPTQARKEDSESSETPLGSLDRTKVSLGDSIRTTDSQRFIRNQWGIEGTMLKILGHIKAGRRPVTVESLVARGPVMVGYRRIIAARCFSSILKLKQHGFIKITKDPETLSIKDILLGPKFEGN